MERMKRQPEEILGHVLAETYTLLIITQNVHWNVRGSQFRGVHLMTEEHYTELFNAIDVIAERIRMIGGKAPATFDEFMKLSSIDDKLDAESQEEMLKELLQAHETIKSTIVSGIKELSECDDFGTIDILTSRLAYHEKIIWMLRSTLGK